MKKRNNLTFSEIKGSLDFSEKSTEILANAKFPVEGSLYFSGVKNTPENFKTKIPIAEWGDGKKLKDITSVVSYVVSCKEWETTKFFLAQSGGFPCLISVWKKEGVRGLPRIDIIGPEKAPIYGNGVEYTPLLESSFLGERRFQIDSGLYPESPDSSYAKHQFSIGAMESSLFISEDKSILFLEKETRFDRVWRRDLPLSVINFFDGKIETGVLSQSIINNKMFSLLENGLLFNGQEICPKNTLLKEEYDHLVMLAKVSFGGWINVNTGDSFDSSIEYNLDRDLTPCLFYEE